MATARGHQMLLGTGIGAKPTGVGMALPVGEVDPLRRAKQIKDKLDALQSSGAAAVLDKIERLVAAFPDGLWLSFPVGTSGGFARRESSRCALKLALSDGPIAGRSIAGAEVLRVYPLTALDRKMSVAIGVQPFEDWLCVGIHCDAKVVPQPGAIAEALRESFGEFLDAAARESRRTGGAGARRAASVAGSGVSADPRSRRGGKDAGRKAYPEIPA